MQAEEIKLSQLIEEIEIKLRENTGLDYDVHEIVLSKQQIQITLKIYDAIDSYILSHVLKEILNKSTLSFHRFVIEHKSNYTLLSITIGDKNG